MTFQAAQKYSVEEIAFEYAEKHVTKRNDSVKTSHWKHEYFMRQFFKLPFIT